MNATDPTRCDLRRFVDAQDPVLDAVRAELEQGEKTTHWMWFVFPQVAGLGTSAMSRRFALSGLDEARAYLGHPILGPRLIDCTQRVLRHTGRAIRTVFGTPDDQKFHSCMTLFALASPEHGVFRTALHAFFDDRLDTATQTHCASR